MRRRLVLLALALDTLGGAAVALALPTSGADGAADAGRYAVVAGACVEVLDAEGGLLAGRLVEAERCTAG